MKIGIEGNKGWKINRKEKKKTMKYILFLFLIGICNLFFLLFFIECIN